MAKKTISRLSVLAVLIVFLAACSKTSEYTNVIPADASVVASINLKSLASKAGLDDKENEAAKQKLLEALKSGMNAATFQQLEKVINNPGASGLDPEAPIYIFSSPQISGGVFVAKVSNEDDLHASLDVMAKEQICQPVSEADGYSFTTLNGNLLAFNETTAIIISANRASQTEALLNPELSRKSQNKKVISTFSPPCQRFLLLTEARSAWDFLLKSSRKTLLL